MFVRSYPVTYCIYTFRHFVFIITAKFIMSANSRVFFASRSYRIADLIIVIIEYMGRHVFSLPMPLVMFERIYIYIYIYIYVYILCLIIIIKSEVWTIIHCLWLGNGTMVCAVYISIFLWYISLCNFGEKNCVLLHVKHISLLAKIYNFWQVCSFVGLSVCLSVCLLVCQFCQA